MRDAFEGQDAIRVAGVAIDRSITGCGIGGKRINDNRKKEARKS